MKKQSGFTLIELVMVIVILGILAAVAIPRFIDLSQEARDASVKGVIGNLASASVINYAACAASDSQCQPYAGVFDDCSEAGILLQGGLSASDYTLTGGVLSSTSGTANTCTVTDAVDGTYTGTVQIITP